MTSLMAGGSEGGLQSENNQEDFGREDSFGGCSYATGEKIKILFLDRNQILWHQLVSEYESKQVLSSFHLRWRMYPV